MTYKTIQNFPDERARITHGHIWWDNAFTEEELERINQYVSTLELEPALVSNGSVEEIFNANRCFINKDENTSWIFETFNRLIEHINEQFFGFDLNGYPYIQYGVYDSETNGNYGFHMDTIMDNNRKDNLYLTRKLSLTLLLNEPGVDFEGGEFEINRSRESDASPIELSKGRMVIFPSFMIHRVKPVTKGVRKSLVIWVMGPKFK